MPTVALFTRAWIEMWAVVPKTVGQYVALFTRAWIEIANAVYNAETSPVALFTRAWIEIESGYSDTLPGICRPLYEGVD